MRIDNGQDRLRHNAARCGALLLCVWMLQGSSHPPSPQLRPPGMVEVLEAQGESELALELLRSGALHADEEITDLVARERNRRKLRLLVRTGGIDEAEDLLRRAHDWFEGAQLPLLRATLALRTAQPESARTHLATLPPLSGPLLGYAHLLRAQAAMETGHWREAHDAVAAAAAAELPLEMRRRLHLIEANAVLHLDQTDELDRLGRQLGRDARHNDENGMLLIRLARATLARGDTMLGVEWAFDLLEARPGPAASAYELLLELQELSSWRPDAAQQLQLALFEMNNDRILQASRRLLVLLEDPGAGLDAEQTGEAWVELARTRQMRGEHSRCLALLADKADVVRGTPAEPEMLRLQARSTRALGDEDGTIALYRDLARRFPGHPRADDALYEVGWRHEIRGNLRRAEEVYGELPRIFPRSALADDATLRQGLCALRDGRHDEALGYFRKMVVRYPNSPLIARALYWRLWIQSRKGDLARVEGLRQRLNEEHPYSYFTVLANAESLQGPPSGRPQGPAPAHGLELAQRNHEIYMAAIGELRHDIQAELPESFRQESNLWRFLLDHGFAVEAAWESHRLERDHQRQPAVLLELLAGNYTRGEHSRLIRISYQLSLLLSRSAATQAIEIIRYPAPFSVGLSATADENRLSHAATLAIMRHESAFDPQVDSRAGARGLMQLMPAVGSTLARQLGVDDFHIDDLYDARTNFMLGCRLLSEELQRADWSLPQALAAYNAGSEPAARWARRLGPQDPHELYLDVAEYYETRSYLERVLGSTAVYQRVYSLP